MDDKKIELVEKILGSLDTVIIPNAENMYKDLKKASNANTNVNFSGVIEEDLNGFLQHVDLIKTYYKNLIEEEGAEYPNWL